MFSCEQIDPGRRETERQRETGKGREKEGGEREKELGREERGERE